jgi:DNA-binding NarL/FixJ family response regulator
MSRSRRQPADRASAHASDALQTLTARELEILALLATGKRSTEIAQQLEITLPTVKTHLIHIYRKLAVANRVQATNLYHLGHPKGTINRQKRRHQNT